MHRSYHNQRTNAEAYKVFVSESEQKIKDDPKCLCICGIRNDSIGRASTAGNLTFKSTATIVAKEGISMGAGAGAQKITTDVTGNDTAGMVAGMVASGVTAKGLNGIEAEANKLAKAPKGIDGVTEGSWKFSGRCGESRKRARGAAKGSRGVQRKDAGKVVETSYGKSREIIQCSDINSKVAKVEEKVPVSDAVMKSLEGSGLTSDRIKEIRDLPKPDYSKGEFVNRDVNKPDPKTYLNPDYYQKHLEPFEKTGCYRIQRTDQCYRMINMVVFWDIIVACLLPLEKT